MDYKGLGIDIEEAEALLWDVMIRRWGPHGRDKQMHILYSAFSPIPSTHHHSLLSVKVICINASHCTDKGGSSCSRTEYHRYRFTGWSDETRRFAGASHFS